MSTVPGEAAPAAAAVRRTVRSQPVDLVGTLLQRLPHAGDALAWVRDGTGLVGWGEAARLEVSGPDRFAQARDWWRAVVAHADVDDEVGARGSGPVAFGSFAFGDDETVGAGACPRWCWGGADGRTWLTTVGEPPRLASPRRRSGAPAGCATRTATSPVTAVPRGGRRRAVARIADGELRQGGARPRPARRRRRRHRRPGRAAPGSPRATPTAGRSRSTGSSARPPSCSSAAPATRWSPGCWPARRPAAATPADDQRCGSRPCCSSAKDREEHRYAVESLAEALAPHVRDLSCRPRRTSLELSNVTHLATDVTGRRRRTAPTCSTWSARCTRRRRSVARRPTLALRAARGARERWTAAATPARSAGSTRAATASGASRCGARSSTGRRRGCSPAAASSPAPTPTPRCSRRRRSSCRCATPSRASRD